MQVAKLVLNDFGDINSLPNGPSDQSTEQADPALPPLALPNPRPHPSLLRSKRSRDDPFSNSSDPPIFSSDDAPSGLENYSFHRSKRQYRGTWWGEKLEPEQTIAGAPSRKKRGLKRTIDSGVWMASDDTNTDTDGEAGLDLEKTLYASRAKKSEPINAMPQLSQAQLDASQYIQQCVDKGVEVIDLS